MPDHSFELDLIFQALANFHRRMMVRRLSREMTSVRELTALLPMSLQAAIQHLDVLEKSGLVQSEKRGRVRMCRLDEGKLNLAEDWIAGRLRSCKRRFTFSQASSRWFR
jgi:DNA-binding transcriptional ArsR family regulator